MGKQKKIYVVTMYRYGDREAHSYVLGVWFSPSEAADAAESERVDRGGNKYLPEVLGFTPGGHGMPEKVIALEEW